MRLQKMSQSTGLLAELEEDHGLSNLATKNDQRTCASFCHLELIRYELGFLGKLEEDFLVPHPGIRPMRMARCDERLDTPTDKEIRTFGNWSLISIWHSLMYG